MPSVPTADSHPDVLAPALLPAQEISSASASKAEGELRQAIRLYDDALRRADVAAVERFWAAEYVFINPRGERVSRDARVANLREKRTAFDSLARAPQEELIRTYMDGNMAVYTTLRQLMVVTVAKPKAESFEPW